MNNLDTKILKRDRRVKREKQKRRGQRAGIGGVLCTASPVTDLFTSVVRPIYWDSAP